MILYIQNSLISPPPHSLSLYLPLCTFLSLSLSLLLLIDRACSWFLSLWRMEYTFWPGQMVNSSVRQCLVSACPHQIIYPPPWKQLAWPFLLLSHAEHWNKMKALVCRTPTVHCKKEKHQNSHIHAYIKTSFDRKVSFRCDELINLKLSNHGC